MLDDGTFWVTLGPGENVAWLLKAWECWAADRWHNESWTSKLCKIEDFMNGNFVPFVEPLLVSRPFYPSLSGQFVSPKSLPIWKKHSDLVEIFRFAKVGRPRQAVRNGQKIRKFFDWNEIFRFPKNLPNWRLKNWPLFSAILQSLWCAKFHSQGEWGMASTRKPLECRPNTSRHNSRLR